MAVKLEQFPEPVFVLTKEKKTDRILIVDDELHTREICSEFLTIDGEFEVEIATNGKEALEMLSQSRFSILLSDIQMPEMDGIVLLKEAKARYPEVEVILMTAYGGLPSAIEAIRFGAYDYLTKPFTRDFLLTRIHKCLEKRGLQVQLKESQSKLIEQEKLAALGAVAAWLSHRMRNSLSVISMCAHYLHEKKIAPETDDFKEVISAVINKTKVLEKITSDLISYSRPYDLQKTEENLNDLLEDVLQSLNVQIQIQSVELKKELARSLPLYLCDPHILQEAFENIIINALHAIGEQKNQFLEVRSELQGGEIAVTFTNSGSVIPQENLEKIFIPFFTTKENGSGLGLAITKKIIEQHEARIFVESSEKEKRTMIRILFPLSNG